MDCSTDLIPIQADMVLFLRLLCFTQPLRVKRYKLVKCAIKHGIKKDTTQMWKSMQISAKGLQIFIRMPLIIRQPFIIIIKSSGWLKIKETRSTIRAPMVNYMYIYQNYHFHTWLSMTNFTPCLLQSPHSQKYCITNVLISSSKQIS